MPETERRGKTSVINATISVVSIDEQGPQLMRPERPEKRNWLPLAIAAGVVIVVAAIAIAVMQHGKKGPTVTPLTAPLDGYAASLPVSHLAMSESANLAGGKQMYVDGVIDNTGNRTVTAVTVQVLFRNAAHEVAQNETQPLKLVRTRNPYVDVQPVSAAPLKPGDEKQFRLTFDAVSPEWDGAYPEIRLVKVESK